MISVLMTVYNEELFLKECIESIFQGNDQIELCIVSDGSKDNTNDIIKEMSKFYNIKYKILEFNKGKAFCQNEAFKMSSGELVAISGGDDINNRLRFIKQYKKIHNIENSYCITNMSTINNNGIHLNSKYIKNFSITDDVYKLLKGNSFPCGTLMMTKDLADKIYPLPLTIDYEDRYISSLCQFFSKNGFFIDEDLYQYRQHQNNTWLTQHESLRFKLKKIKNLIKRDVNVAIELNEVFKLNRDYENNFIDIVVIFLNRVSGENFKLKYSLQVLKTLGFKKFLSYNFPILYLVINAI